MIDIVIQGGIWNITQRAIQEYRQLPFVNNVILSTWEGEAMLDSIHHDNIIISNKPINGGQCNINLQIISSQSGIAACESSTVVKCRTDQIISKQCFTELYNFYTQQSKNNKPIHRIEGDHYNYPIYVWGLNSIYPYCPQDHFFMGSKESMSLLMSCPLSDGEIKGQYIAFNEEHIQADGNLDWNYADLRPNIYIGGHFCGLFSKKAKSHIDNYRQYLVDKAPGREEAQEESTRIINHIFKVMPRVDIFWEKMPDKKYPFNLYESQGEYYYN